MKKFPYILLAIGLAANLALIASLGWGQQLISQGLVGNEFVEAQQGAQGPGGTGIFVTTGRLSNGRSTAYFTAFPTATFTIGGANPTGAATVSTVGVANGGDLLFNVTNGSAITINMPVTTNLLDGEIIGICNVTTSAWATNAVTVAAQSNQSIVTVAGNSTTLTTLAAGTCNRWIWNAVATTWFPIIGG